MTENRKIVIAELPQGALSESHYRLETEAVPEPGDREVLCRTLALSIAAGTRAALQGSASYAGAPAAGIVMPGMAVARVEKSNDAAFAQGDLVICRAGWQDYSSHPARQLERIPADGDPALYLGALGTNGLTAYFGLLDVGEPREGETVVVSAAAGSVGHVVGQIARIQGCRVVGVAGSQRKCDLLIDQLGFDAAVNYKEADFRKLFKAACGDGIDIYFDNTGGDILGSALFGMKIGGRIVCCGVVSQYDTATPSPGPRGVPGLLINKRLRMEGFLIFDYAKRYAEAREQIGAWIASGELVALQDEIQGLEEAPRAFVDLLAGGNVGTRIVQVSSG